MAAAATAVVACNRPHGIDDDNHELHLSSLAGFFGFRVHSWRGRCLMADSRSRHASGIAAGASHVVA
jgi:hypothetical protein